MYKNFLSFKKKSLSRRVSDENRACSISIRFFQNYGSVCRKVILMCSHDPIIGTNENWILEIEQCERAFKACCKIDVTSVMPN